MATSFAKRGKSAAAPGLVRFRHFAASVQLTLPLPGRARNTRPAPSASGTHTANPRPPASTKAPVAAFQTIARTAEKPGSRAVSVTPSSASENERMSITK